MLVNETWSRRWISIVSSVKVAASLNPASVQVDHCVFCLPSQALAAGIVAHFVWWKDAETVASPPRHTFGIEALPQTSTSAIDCQVFASLVSRRRRALAAGRARASITATGAACVAS